MCTLTIIVPTYNRPLLVQQAVSSALSQVDAPVQVLVIDDCGPTSPDFSALSGCRLTFIRNEQNLGIAGTWRKAVSLVQTAYFAILHDDDFYCEDFARTMLSLAEAYPQVPAVFCGHFVATEDGQVSMEKTEANDRQWGRTNLREGLVEDPREPLVFRMSFHPGAAIYRRSMVTPEMIDPTIQGCIDVWLFYQIARLRLPVYFSPRRLMVYREHSGGMSKSMPDTMITGHLQCLRAMLADPILSSHRRVLRRQLGEFQMMHAGRLALQGDFGAVLPQALQALWLSRTPKAFAKVWLYTARAFCRGLMQKKSS